MSPLFFVALGIALVVDVLYWHVRFVRAVRRRPVPPQPLDGYPSVSVVRPVRGRDVDAEANFAAALDTGYPGKVETIFVVDDLDDPALPLLRDAVAAHHAAGGHGTARVIVGGHPPAHRTGKLNAMMAGMRVAHGELVAFGDSDSRPDRDVLRILADTLLADPKAGCTFAPVVVPRPAEMAGDLGYALMINGLYGPAVALAAHKTGDLPFIMGQLMLFRREALASIGGLASADGHLVDDMRLGACLAEAGWRNIPSYHPLPIMTGGMDVPTFLKLMRRWLFFQKAGLPMAFTWPLWMRGLVFALGIVLSIWAVAAGYPLIAMVPFLATITVSWSIATLHREFGGAPVALRHIWVPLGVLFAGPIAQAAVLLKPSVNWRGRDYALDSDARLEGWGGTAHSEPGMAVGGFDADDDPGYDPSMGRVPAPIASHYNHKSPGGFRSPVRN